VNPFRIYRNYWQDMGSRIGASPEIPHPPTNPSAGLPQAGGLALAAAK
jgi:hypothetical protein